MERAGGITAHRTAGPPPWRARSTDSCITRYTATASFPSTVRTGSLSRFANRLMKKKSSAGSRCLPSRARAPLVASAHARMIGNCACCAHSNAGIQPGSGVPAFVRASTRPSAPAACRPRAAAAQSGSLDSIANPPMALPQLGFFAGGARAPAVASPSAALNRSPGRSCMRVAASNASRTALDLCLRSKARARCIRAYNSRSLRWGSSGFSDKP